MSQLHNQCDDAKEDSPDNQYQKLGEELSPHPLCGGGIIRIAAGTEQSVEPCYQLPHPSPIMAFVPEILS
jgi:hypothetical protein